MDYQWSVSRLNELESILANPETYADSAKARVLL